MMIALTFNGVLTSEHSKFIKRILNPVFRNPNGCAVQGTFFLSGSGNGTTDYCFAQSLFNNNNEIAVSSTKYQCPYTDCESLGRYFRRWREESADTDIYEQKKNIALNARINRSFLRGFRVPFLDQRGNSHFRALKKYAFNYDSSVIIKPQDIRKHEGFRLWPHTLDFPANYTCPTCPTKKGYCSSSQNCSLSSVWVVPMHYYNATGKNPCPTLIKDDIADNRLDTKSCIPRNELTQKILEDLLFHDFDIYMGNKAPFVINIELNWFDKYGEILTNALVKFINELTDINSRRSSGNNVYFVTVSKIIEWIEYPTPLNVIAGKWLWDCEGVIYDYDQECESIKKLREDQEELEEIKKKNKTKQLDLQTEVLFQNGVLPSTVAIFILSFLFVVFYDMYS